VITKVTLSSNLFLPSHLYLHTKILKLLASFENTPLGQIESLLVQPAYFPLFRITIEKAIKFQLLFFFKNLPKTVPKAQRQPGKQRNEFAIKEEQKLKLKFL
jgi:hypothetical protein